MPRKTSRKKTSSNWFKASNRAMKPDLHVYNNETLCVTNRRGFATPENRSPAEIVLDATEGFVPLWDRNMILHWQFDDVSMEYFQDPEEAMDGIRDLMGEAILAWGDAAPVRFKESDGNWDFRVEMREVDRCNQSGCVLASAFFPDPGQNRLVLYPELFDQSRKEQVETMIHEFGHVFGLRHFFAQIEETQWASEVFGEHSPFSIMNYGHKSILTDADRSDLKQLYQSAWSGQIDDVNGTPIRLIRPSSATSMELVVGTSQDGGALAAPPIAAANNVLSREELGASLKLTEEYIAPGRRNRPGRENNPEFVTIHNTDNTSPGADARAHSKFVRNKGYYVWRGRRRPVSWHYTVDDKRVIKQLPIDEEAYHAGAGNRQSIAIETCMHAEINQSAAHDRLARLVAVLRYDLGLDRSQIVPHKHWTNKNCPSLLLREWDDFLDNVDRYVEAMEAFDRSSMYIARQDPVDLEHDAVAAEVNAMISVTA